MVAAMRCQRNSIGLEIDRDYCRLAARRLRHENNDLFSQAELHFLKLTESPEEGLRVCEDATLYGSKKALRARTG